MSDRNMCRCGFAAVLVAAVLLPVPAYADKAAPDAPCKQVPSVASHCDWNGRNDVTGNHPASDEHANANSDCNARVCAPAPSPSPSPSPTVTVDPDPDPEPDPDVVPLPLAVPLVEPVEAVSVAVPARATVVLPARIPAKAVLPAKIPAKAVLPARVEGGS